MFKVRKNPSYMHDSMKRLLDAARDERSRARVQDFGDLQTALGVSSAVMTNWKKRGVSAGGALKAEELVGCLAQWVLAGTQPMFVDADHSVQTSANHSFAGTLSVETLYAFTVPPLTTWEKLMSATTPLPELIRLAVPDDALPDEAPLGTELIMSTTAAARRGDIVLVRDRAGGLYLRLYAEGRAGGWRAVTPRRDDVYLSLDSEADGLTLVAVAEWGRLRRK